MGKDLLLVGSIPLDTAEEVMRTFGGPLGPYLPAMPDGEVGERRSWVNRFCYLVYSGHRDLETLHRPPDLNGVEQLLPVKREDSWKFRVRPGVKEVRFGMPGLRLGYARDATASYFVFKTLREKGVLPPDMRFQISIPMVNSVVRTLYFPEPGDIDKIFGGWPSFTPPDFGRAVELINASIEAAGRRSDWVHIPTLDRADPAHYTPFKELQTGDARIYLGMIHNMESLARRIEAAHRVIPNFGLAAYCGFGRTPPEQLPQILEDHLKAVEMIRQA